MTGHAWLIRVTHLWLFWASSLPLGLSFSQILPHGLTSSYYNKSLTPNCTAVLLPRLIPDWYKTWARANFGPTDPERQCVDHGKVTPCVRQALGSSQPLQVASFSVSLAMTACPQVHIHEATGRRGNRDLSPVSALPVILYTCLNLPEDVYISKVWRSECRLSHVFDTFSLKKDSIPCFPVLVNVGVAMELVPVNEMWG